MATVRHLEFWKISVLVTWPVLACDSSSPFRISRWSANKAQRYSQKTIFKMASVRHLEFEKFRFFLSNSHPQNVNLHRHTKFDRNRIIPGWDMEIKLFSKWRPSAVLNLRKLQFRVTWPISACDPSSLFQISHWSANMAPRYSQKTIVNMASVRHLGFVMTSSYCIWKLHFTFPTLC